MIFEKTLNARNEERQDPRIYVTKYSEESTIRIVVSHQHDHMTIITISPDTANKLGWALLQAVSAKKGEQL